MDQGIAVAWKLVLGRFCAGAHVGPGPRPGFRLTCVPQLLRHTLAAALAIQLRAGLSQAAS